MFICVVQEYNLPNDKMAYIKHKYLTLGKTVTSMFMQGGWGLCGQFSHTLISYGNGGWKAATIDTLPEDKQALVENVFWLNRAENYQI